MLVYPVLVDYKTALGIIATLIAFISYIPYFRDIFAGRTKPHAFSWLVWGVLQAISFASQIAGQGGPGAWVFGFTSLLSFVIFFFALVRGEKNIVLVDWLSLGGVAVALILWWLTGGPLLSVILIAVIDVLGFVPTFRKSFHKPHEETLSVWVLSAVKYIPAILALRAYSLITLLYPATLVISNSALVLMLLARRKKLSNSIHPADNN